MDLEQALEKFCREKKLASPKPGSGKVCPIVPDYVGFLLWFDKPFNDTENLVVLHDQFTDEQVGHSPPSILIESGFDKHNRIFYIDPTTSPNRGLLDRFSIFFREPL